MNNLPGFSVGAGQLYPEPGIIDSGLVGVEILHHQHDIEACGSAQQVMFRQEILGNSIEPMLFADINAKRGAQSGTASRCPHLDEYHRIFVSGHDVEFAERAGVVAKQNVQAPVREELSGQCFRFQAESSPLIRLLRIASHTAIPTRSGIVQDAHRCGQEALLVALASLSVAFGPVSCRSRSLVALPTRSRR